MSINKHIGLDGFVWFIGVVEDRNDPTKLGRVKVRCVSFHTDNLNDLPTKDLPWAQVMQPTTSTANSGKGISPFIVEGTWVVGFFLDAETKQQPIVMGTLPGKPANLADTSKGFNDPNGKYPLVANVSDLSDLAQGIAFDNSENQSKDITIANSTTTYNEPDNTAKPVYPFNRVFETESGHFKEYDDTEGAERIQEQHKSGTFYVIDKDGNKVTRVVKDNYDITLGDDYAYIKGTCNLTIDSNCNTHIKGNWNIQVDGNKIENVKGTSTETVTGVMTKTGSATGSEVTAGKIKLTKHTHTDPAGLAGAETSTPN